MHINMRIPNKKSHKVALWGRVCWYVKEAAPSRQQNCTEPPGRAGQHAVIATSLTDLAMGQAAPKRI